MKFLLIDGDTKEREAIVHRVERDYPGVEVEQVGGSKDLEAALARGDFDLVLTNYRQDWVDGVRALRQIQERRPGVPVVVIAEPAEREPLLQDLCETFTNTQQVARSSYSLAVGQMDADRTFSLAWTNALMQQQTRALEAKSEELKAKEQALQATNRALEQLSAEVEAQRARLSAILSSAPEPILVADREGDIVLMNPAAQFMAGIDPVGIGLEELVRRLNARLDRNRPRIAPVPLLLNPALAGEKVENVRLFLDTLAGPDRVVQTSVSPFYQGDTVKGAVLTLHDLTDLEQSRELSETLNRVDTLLGSVRDIDAVMPQVLAEAAAGLHADIAVVSRREKDCWVILHTHGLPKELLGRAFRDEEMEFSTYGAQEKRVVLIQDIERDPRFRGKLAKRHGFVSLMVVPLLWQGRVMGVITFSSTMHSLSLGSIQADFGRKLAASIVLAQENARLYELARRDAETKAVLLREVNHRVKNNLAAIIGLLYMQRDRPGMKDQPTYQAVIRDLIHWTEGLSIAQGMLSESEWAPLRLDELASQVMRSCFQSLPRGRLVVQVRPSPVFVSAGQAHSLALVINELALNVAKHTLNGREEGQITVEAGREGGEVVLTLRDDGPGYPAEVLAREQAGVGLGLVNKLICRNLRGRLTLRNEGGAVAEVRFPEQVEPGD